MNNAELLAEARRKYPIGTEIKSPESGNIFIISTDTFSMNGHGNIQGRCNKYNRPYVYYNDKWAEVIKAEVIKAVEPQIINNYQIY